MKNDGNEVRSVEINDNDLENVSGGKIQIYTVYVITDKDDKVILETESISEAINCINQNPGSKMSQLNRIR